MVEVSMVARCTRSGDRYQKTRTNATELADCSEKHIGRSASGLIDPWAFVSVHILQTNVVKPLFNETLPSQECLSASVPTSCRNAHTSHSHS